MGNIPKEVYDVPLTLEILAGGNLDLQMFARMSLGVSMSMNPLLKLAIGSWRRNS